MVMRSSAVNQIELQCQVWLTSGSSLNRVQVDFGGVNLKLTLQKQNRIDCIYIINALISHKVLIAIFKMLIVCVTRLLTINNICESHWKTGVLLSICGLNLVVGDDFLCFFNSIHNYVLWKLYMPYSRTFKKIMLVYNTAAINFA